MHILTTFCRTLVEMCDFFSHFFFNNNGIQIGWKVGQLLFSFFLFCHFTSFPNASECKRIAVRSVPILLLYYIVGVLSFKVGLIIIVSFHMNV